MGLWLVQLDQVRDQALVAQAVAGVLGLQDRTGYAPPRHGMRARAEAPGHRAAPLPPPAAPASESPRCRYRRQRNHAACVMAFHADRREARGQQLRGEGSEFNAIRRSGPMREDGGLTGCGMTPARYDVPAVERSHARRPAALCARPCLPARAADHPLIVHRPLAGRAAARGEAPLKQEGSPVQVPMTVEPPAGRFTAWVVRT